MASTRLFLFWMILGVATTFCFYFFTKPREPSPRTSKIRNVPNEITFAITCGTGETDAIDEMQPLLKSILAFTSAPIRFLFITDGEGVRTINQLFSEKLVRTKHPVSVEIHRVEKTVIDNWAHAIKLDPKNHHSGRFGTAKLMIPWLFPQHQKAIVLDTDMVMLDDPARLWTEFETGNTNWVYKFPSTRRAAWNQMCSCVVLINLQKARKYELYPKSMAKALAFEPSWYRKSANLYYPNGDQGVYWLMMQISPHLFERLPDKWMRDRCHNYWGALRPRDMRKVSMLHRNCGSTNSSSFEDEASPFFNFFLHYRWHWLQPEEHEFGYKVELKNFTSRPVIK